MEILLWILFFFLMFLVISLFIVSIKLWKEKARLFSIISLAGAITLLILGFSMKNGGEDLIRADEVYKTYPQLHWEPVGGDNIIKKMGGKNGIAIFPLEQDEFIIFYDKEEFHPS